MTHPEAGASYAWRKIFYSDGEPWLDEAMPWFLSREEARAYYESYVQQGRVERGSNVVKDRYDATIDTNCWIMRRTTADAFPWPIEFTPELIRRRFTEDMILTRQMHAAGVSVICTELSTVNYMLPVPHDVNPERRMNRSSLIELHTTSSGDSILSI